MNNQTILLAVSILLCSGASIAADMQTSATSDKQAVLAETAKPEAKASGTKVRKAAVPETQKDRENKKKCRGLGGTWQLGHCNVG